MSENNLKRDYPRIFLTDELGEVNWCQDRITVEDVEYVPVSDLIASQAEVTRLRKALEKIAAGDDNISSHPWTARQALTSKEPS